MLVPIVASLGIMYYALPQATCADNESKKEDSADPSGSAKKIDDPVEKLIENMVPIFAPLGFGGIMGFCSGIVAKRVSYESAYIVGLVRYHQTVARAAT